MYQYVALALLWLIITFMNGAGNVTTKLSVSEYFLKCASDYYYYYCDTEKILLANGSHIVILQISYTVL